DGLDPPGCVALLPPQAPPATNPEWRNGKPFLGLIRYEALSLPPSPPEGGGRPPGPRISVAGCRREKNHGRKEAACSPEDRLDPGGPGPAPGDPGGVQGRPPRAGGTPGHRGIRRAGPAGALPGVAVPAVWPEAGPPGGGADPGGRVGPVRHRQVRAEPAGERPLREPDPGHPLPVRRGRGEGGAVRRRGPGTGRGGWSLNRVFWSEIPIAAAQRRGDFIWRRWHPTL